VNFSVMRTRTVRSAKFLGDFYSESRVGYACTGPRAALASVIGVFDGTTNTAHDIHGFESCVDTMQLPNVVCALCMTRRFHTLCRPQNWRNLALFGRRPVGMCMSALLLMHLFSYLSM